VACNLPSECHREEPGTDDAWVASGYGAVQHSANGGVETVGSSLSLVFGRYEAGETSERDEGPILR